MKLKTVLAAIVHTGIGHKSAICRFSWHTGGYIVILQLQLVFQIIQSREL